MRVHIYFFNFNKGILTQKSMSLALGEIYRLMNLNEVHSEIHPYLYA